MKLTFQFLFQGNRFTIHFNPLHSNPSVLLYEKCYYSLTKLLFAVPFGVKIILYVVKWPAHQHGTDHFKTFYPNKIRKAFQWGKFNCLSKTIIEALHWMVVWCTIGDVSPRNEPRFDKSSLKYPKRIRTVPESCQVGYSTCHHHYNHS